MLTCKRDFFSIPEDQHYLNAAYMGPLSRASQEAAQRAVRRKALPYTIESRDFFEESDEARALFARLVNIPAPQSVALIPSVSYGVGIAARNLTARAGQSIVLVEEEFPSNVYPWRALAREKGLHIRTVGAPVAVPNRAEEWSQALLEAIDADTACVALPQVHWADGTIFDLESIARRCREVSAMLVVDGTQSVGAFPFDVERIRPDVLVVAGYKWLLGPYSMGLLYLAPRLLAEGRPLEETWLGRVGAEDFAGLVRYRDEYQPGAARFDVGERSNFLLMPILVTALRQLLEWGVEDIQAYCRALSTPLVEDARELGFTAEEDAWRAPHLFGLRLPAGLDSARLQQALAERAVHVSRRGSALRIAPHVYNDKRDTAALRDALKAALS
ncbi:MAG TPA: aminotransferase class V-fold PLP-dependent enzyme [Longimicrobiales bacterium]